MVDVPSLTRTEAEQRAALVTVERYDIDVDLTGLADGPTWRATSTITFGCAEPGADSFVDCGATVRSVTLNGVEVPRDRIAGGRIQLVDLAAVNVLVVACEQQDTASQRGVQRCVDPGDGQVYVWTSFEPDEAQRCWACFDQPDLKAPYAFSVLAPAAWTVLSNSAVDTVTPVGEARRWVFPDTPPLSTYVVVLDAGPFHELRSTRAGHDLRLLCRASLAPVLERDAEELFSLTAAGLELFGREFGQPFAQRTYDQVFVPDMPGAMENWGCVTWGDFALYRATPTRRERALRAEILLHEMAHMWFGDLVTMRWWDDLWLNEAFASWASLWASTRVSEFSDAWATFLTSDKSKGYAADRAVTSHPIRQPAGDVAEATASFDAITYVKGASVLKQLVATVGEEDFLEALRAYFAQHSWGNTTLGDLMAAVQQTSGQDLETWTAAWLDRAGTDRIALERHGETWVVQVTAPDGGPPRHHRLDIGGYTRTRSGDAGGDGPEDPRWRRTALREVRTTGERTSVPAPEAVEGSVDLLLVNDDDLTFASSRTDPASQELMLSSAGGLPTPMARAVAVTSAWDLLTDAEISTGTFVACGVEVVRAETEPGVANDVLAMLRSAADLWSPPAQRDDLLARVAEVAAAMVAKPDQRDTALRTLSRTAVEEADLALVREHALGDVELHWMLLTRLAGLARLDDSELEALLAHDPDPDAGLRAVAVRAALPRRESKEEVWKAVFVDRTVPPDRYSEVGDAFWQRGQEPSLEGFTGRFLDTVAGQGGNAMVAMSLARGMFPSAVGDEQFLADLRRTADGPSVSPTVRQSLLERGDALRRMLRARST
jgi:aminopeptidase N